jgi:hypothetical protein
MMWYGIESRSRRMFNSVIVPLEAVTGFISVVLISAVVEILSVCLLFLGTAGTRRIGRICDRAVYGEEGDGNLSCWAY